MTWFSCNFANLEFNKLESRINFILLQFCCFCILFSFNLFEIPEEENNNGNGRNAAATGASDK